MRKLDSDQKTLLLIILFLIIGVVGGYYIPAEGL
jgi:uncharacterized protein YneF (UPF0154 family)